MSQFPHGTPFGNFQQPPPINPFSAPSSGQPYSQIHTHPSSFPVASSSYQQPYPGQQSHSGPWNQVPLPSQQYSQPQPPPPQYSQLQPPPPQYSQPPQYFQPQPPPPQYSQLQPPPPPQFSQQQQHPYAGLSQDEITEHQEVGKKLSLNPYQVRKLYWNRNLLESIKDTTTFEEISSRFTGTAWDGLHLVYTLQSIQNSNQYNTDEQAEIQRRLVILVALFTDQYLPPLADVREKRPPDPMRHYVYQFYRNITCQNPLSITGLTNARQLKAPVPCGPTTKYVEIKNLSDLPRRHTATRVHVLAKDTVDAATEIVALFPKTRVAVLNMTHPRHPGGSWKKGEVSQEESLFLRTGLSRGLDRDDYPLETFTCLYTEDVRVIRGNTDTGYAFFDSARGEGVTFDVISMAGIDASTDKGRKAHNAFTGKEAATNRAKFELLLNVCAVRQADVLVLGAIGCGAFDNPPDAVARAFRAMIELYAGYFSDIYFAIYGTSTANVFAHELLGPSYLCDPDRDTAARCPTFEYPKFCNSMDLPTDVRSRVCEEAGCCTALDSEHYRQFQHPPFCPLTDCPYLQDSSLEGAEYHFFNFSHRVMCPLRGRCTKNANDDIHAHRFKHPDRCRRGAMCEDISDAHMLEFMHPPLCPNGVHCRDRANPAHANAFRHAAAPCPFGHGCRLLFDSKHMEAYAHPFLPPCEDSPYCCRDDSAAHKAQHSHLCKYGPNCRDMENPEHTKYFYHAGLVCPHGDNCNDFSDEHLQTYCHPNVPIVRKRCRTPWCTNMNPQHRREYYHLPTRMALSPVDMLNCRDPGDQEAYGDFSKTAGARVPFFSNTTKWLDRLNRYIGPDFSTQSRNFREIRAWFENLRPIHMCDAVTAISMCKTGAMLSSMKMKTLWESKRDIVNCTFSREVTRKILGDNPERIKRLKKYGGKYVLMRQGLIAKDKIPKLSADATKNAQAIKIYQKTGVIGPDKENELKECFAACVSVCGEDLVRKVEKELDDVVDAISKLIDNAPGINHDSDEIMRTNHIVFSIVGPHYHNYGDTEVVFVMRKTIMWHPDFYMTPGAATSFRKCHYHMGREPWMGPSKPADGGAMDDYFTEKFSLIDPRWSEAAAKDFIFRTLNVEFKRPITEASMVTLDMLRQYWSKVNAHAVIEGHLPSLVPLDYVEHIIIQKSAYEKIMKDPIAKAQFDAWVKRYGPNFIEVVNTDVEVRKANDEYLLRTPPLYVPTGYSFAIYGKREQFMPIKFKSDEKKIFIYFMACGGMFSISVSNIGDLTAPGIKRDVATFTVNSSMKGVSAYFLPPLANLNAKKVGEMLDFNSGCPITKFVNYVLCVDHTTNTLTLKHWGASSLFNNKELTIKFDQGIVYSHFSFSSTVDVEEPPRIWSLSIEYQERPNSVFLLPTEADVQAKLRSAPPPHGPSISPQQQQQQQQYQQPAWGNQQQPAWGNQNQPAWGGQQQQPAWGNQQQPAWGNQNQPAWGGQQQQNTPTWGQNNNQQSWGGGWK